MKDIKVNTKQRNAQAWSKSLNKVNESRAGQVAIAYLDDNKQKRTGYLPITDISLVVGEKEITLGNLLSELLNLNVEMLKVREQTLKQVNLIAEGVASSGNDLLIVKTNEEGYIDKILEFNNKLDLVVAEQSIPHDYDKGYHYIKDGVITFDEKKKLELYPDFV